MKKKLLIIVPIILVLIIGIFTGLYFLTDLFKSPKTLFYKYLAQSIESESGKYSYDDFLEELKKQSETNSSSNGNITIETSLEDESYDILKDMKIDYSAKVAPSQEKAYYNAEVAYKNKKIATGELLITDNKYGVKSNNIYDKYIYAENSNLKSLAEKLGIDNTSIPDSFEKINIYDLYYISKEKRKSITDRYFDILDEKLDKDKFSAEKNVEIDVNGESIKADAYTLSINSSDVYDIMLSIFETLKDDDETLDLLMEKYDMLNINESLISAKSENISISKEDIKSAIQDIITELEQYESYSEDSNTNIKLTVYASKGDRKSTRLNSSH